MVLSAFFYATMAASFLSLSPPSRDVYTYVDRAGGMRQMASANGSNAMLRVWSTSWARHGWVPHVIGPSVLLSDPEYNHTMQTINHFAKAICLATTPWLAGEDMRKQIAFRRRGLMQFYAKAVVGDGVLVDSDVINYGLTPEDVADARRAAHERHWHALTPEQRPSFARKEGGERVVLHDGRKCACLEPEESADARREWNATGRQLHMPRRSVPGFFGRFFGAAPCAQIRCVHVNGGFASGPGTAFRYFIRGWFRHLRARERGAVQSSRRDDKRKRGMALALQTQCPLLPMRRRRACSLLTLQLFVACVWNRHGPAAGD